jgi:hypothetical protein
MMTLANAKILAALGKRVRQARILPSHVAASGSPPMTSRIKSLTATRLS